MYYNYEKNNTINKVDIMLGLIEDVNIISSFRKQNISYMKYESRKSHGFVLR